MIFHELIELDTYYEVRKAAPQVPVLPVQTAQMALVVMDRMTVPEFQSLDAALNPYWHVPYEYIREQLPVMVSSHELGAVLRGMGLICHRKGCGYIVIWNQAQMDILLKRFGLRENELGGDRMYEIINCRSECQGTLAGMVES